jgi:hypothetical protein
MLGSSLSAFADTYTYTLSGQFDAFTYTSPTLLSTDVTIPAAALGSCSIYGGAQGQHCTSVEFNVPANILLVNSFAPPGNGYGAETDEYDNVNFAAGNHTANSGAEGNYTFNITDNPSVAAVPEPSSLILLSTGVLGAIGAARRRRA